MPSFFRLSALALAVLLTGSLGACSHCSSAACAADAQLQAQVTSSINAESALQADDITVQVRDGVVYLNGLVDTATEVDEAAAIAGQQQGVRRVVNMLQARNAW